MAQNDETAIVTSPEYWRQLLEHTQALEAVVAMYNAEKRGEMEEFTPDQLEEWVTENNTLAKTV